MKKGRPGIILNIICETGLADLVKEIVFSESTSLGIRTFQFRKDTLVREFSKVPTIYGEVTLKHSYFKGKVVSVKPEFEDCKRIALERRIPLKDVYNNIISVITKAQN
jgi:hypothetical protein